MRHISFLTRLLLSLQRPSNHAGSTVERDSSDQGGACIDPVRSHGRRSKQDLKHALHQLKVIQHERQTRMPRLRKAPEAA